VTVPGPTPAPPLRTLEASLADSELKASCAVIYEHPAVRWLLGGELHPGGEATTRRALELIRVGHGDRLLDIASGTGSSSMLAARDFGCVVVGVDYGEEAVRGAQIAADAAGLCDEVGFIVADAEALPFAGGAFDAVLCECSLCTFPDKARAMAEIRRVLRPGGRLALCDVVVDRDSLPAELRGWLATIACVSEALSREAYEDLLESAGLRLIAIESHDEDAAALAERLQDRLRGARVLGLDRIEGSPIAAKQAIELVWAARRAISEGSLGYTIFGAAC
jgi:arsenite methyltransferase